MILQNEAGVYYTVHPGQGGTHFEYNAFHIPTGTRHKRSISILGSEKELITLLQHWNQQPYWIYYP
jgi:hypothetical protein